MEKNLHGNINSWEGEYLPAYHASPSGGERSARAGVPRSQSIEAWWQGNVSPVHSGSHLAELGERAAPGHHGHTPDWNTRWGAAPPGARGAMPEAMPGQERGKARAHEPRDASRAVKRTAGRSAGPPHGNPAARKDSRLAH